MNLTAIHKYMNNYKVIDALTESQMKYKHQAQHSQLMARLHIYKCCGIREGLGMGQAPNSSIAFVVESCLQWNDEYWGC